MNTLNLDVSRSFDAKGRMTAPILPEAIQLAEAILRGNTPTLSGVQLDPPGRFVAKSYSATLTKLVLAGQSKPPACFPMFFCAHSLFNAGHAIGAGDGMGNMDLDLDRAALQQIG